MLTVFIIASFVCWVAGFFINGFTLYNVLLIIPTVMFALRKFDIHVKLANIVTCEIMFLFFSIAWRLLFHKMVILRLILTLLVRAIFILIVVYDNTAYVYVNEEKKI